MNYAEVIKDIHQLIGLELDSIRPGAKITLLDIDEGSILLKTSTGQIRRRSLHEVQTIWQAMVTSPAVHVDGVLHGSGTSRNQPETILANLPYVEWLKVDNKKHIAFVGNKTHAYGTIQQMDDISAAEIVSKMATSKGFSNLHMVISTKDLENSIDNLQLLCPGSVETLDKGIYQYRTQTETIVILASYIWGIDEGAYCVLKTSQRIASEKKICLYGRYYSIISNDVFKILLEEE